MEPNWQQGTELNSGNWYGATLPAYVLEVGSAPIAQGSELVEDAEGYAQVNIYREYADLTVYIAQDGDLVLEYYQEGEGMYPGNPENGERITYYIRHCTDVHQALYHGKLVLQRVEDLLPETLLEDKINWEKVEV